MAGILRLSNTGTGNGQSTITSAASGDTTYTLPSGGGTFVTTGSTQSLTVPFASGTASAPSVTFIGDTDTGLYSPGANQVALSTSGTGRLFVSSAGLVSIGTSNPFTNFEVQTTANGTAAAIYRQSSTGGGSIIKTNNGYSSTVPIYAFWYSDQTGIGNPAANTISAIIGGGEAARIDSSGRLLIGTSTSIAVAGGNNLFQTFSSTSDRPLGTHVGINGIFGPNIVLSKSRNTTFGSYTAVQSGDILGAIQFAGDDGTDYESTAASIKVEVDGTPGANDMPGRLVFSTTADGASSPTERMRITQAGFTKITSTGSVYQATGTYHEMLSGSSSSPVLFCQHSSATGAGVEVYYTNTINGTANRFFWGYDNTATRFEVRSNGGIGNYQANNVNLSDRNAKKDISLAAGTWNCLKQWEIVNYRYKDQPDDADLNLGVIAQQVAKSCPEVITVFEEAKDDQPEKLGVKEQQMYWMAIKALQEAMSRIETLEAKVAALESA